MPTLILTCYSYLAPEKAGSSRKRGYLPTSKSVAFRSNRSPRRQKFFGRPPAQLERAGGSRDARTNDLPG
jgi:hypothetical protein